MRNGFSESEKKRAKKTHQPLESQQQQANNKIKTEIAPRNGMEWILWPWAPYIKHYRFHSK